jgi:hypothetical protein
MPGSGRNKHRIPGRQTLSDIRVVTARAHFHHRTSLLDPDQLVGIFVNFKTDFTAGRNAHQRHLQMRTRPERCAKILILSSEAGDVSHIGIGTKIGLSGTSIAIHKKLHRVFLLEYVSSGGLTM